MSKPIAFLSVDKTPDYLFLVPVVAKSWELQGFDVMCNLVEPNELISQYCKTIVSYEQYTSINPALYSQCIRLYMYLYVDNPETYCIISDADMFIGSSFLSRNYSTVNVYGHDLTGYQQVPMCYVGAPVWAWHQIMGNDGMREDLLNHSDFRSELKHLAWVSDQAILTAKLKAYKGGINKVTRGIDPKNQNLPYGRCDRYGNFRIPSGPIHDIHLMRDPLNHIDKLIELCKLCYPAEDWGWIRGYAEEFKKEL